MPRDTGIASRLRSAGLKVVEVAGWQTRGSVYFSPIGSIDHHTAGSSIGNAPSLKICTYGYGGLNGPLCNVLIGRDNTCYVVAAGKANHAGSGTWKGLVGNSSVFGVERENIGNPNEPWRKDQTITAAKVHAALISSHTANPEYVCEHKEWAPNRKFDAHSIDGSYMRGLVRYFLKKPNNSPEFLNVVDDMAKEKSVIKLGSTGADVKFLQDSINKIVGKNILIADGIFGTITDRWVKQFQKDRNLIADGIVGYKTWAQLLIANLKV